MGLSKNLVSEFVKVTKNDPDDKVATLYGTIMTTEGIKYVQIDGSNELTPYVSVTDVATGERVLVNIENHTATVTGNLTNPAAKVDVVNNISSSVSNLEDDLEELETDIVNTIQSSMEGLEVDLTATNAEIERLKVEDLYAMNATIDNLVANKASIGQLTAVSAEIERLKVEDLYALDAEIERLKVEDLTAINAEITNLTADKADVTELEAAEARIDDLYATKATIVQLESDYITANEIETTYLTATQIAAEYTNTNTLNAQFATVDMANITDATIGTVLANIGLITQATITDGHVTGYLDAVEVNANSVTAGTLSVDRLVFSGTDKSIVYSLNNIGELVSTEVNTLNGDVLTPRTITAEHIVAGTITSNELHSDSVTSDKVVAGAITASKINVISLESIVATIGSFTINNALYSNGHSEYNSEVQGVYVGSDYISVGNGGKTWLKADGSVSIGDGSITFDAITDELNIVANSVTVETENSESVAVATVDNVATADQSLEEAISSVNDNMVADETRLQILEDSISTLIKDVNGTSLMEQTSTGWEFSLGNVMEQINEAWTKADSMSSDLNTVAGNVTGILEDIENLNTINSRIKIGSTGSTPYIDLYATDSSFRVRITNTSIDFMEGEIIPASINNKRLNIDVAQINESLNFGTTGYSLIKRQNGNLGLTWKGWS